ncbi:MULTISPECIES: hypothetical protein [Halobacteriovorax]|uniref:Uncharacterized protein n=1 Tax=Halobacteriovorax vibrionivorans TaxID=2152716 RepID=A0ABY0ILL7_9BACT|nr:MULTISPECIES: hypothetical protein [Halobacteriovorax]RZF22147.1 hypothetical protein DAY19_10725 [Halobacteriovorax vibrionivorans]TGD47153.1 hypothetical protein EP118_09090 [Halobacteriovorax sp. Y22]
MKNLLILTMLLSTSAQADLFDNLTANLNLSPSQSQNLRNGLSSILNGGGSSQVKIKENLSFNKCFQMLEAAKNKQINNDQALVNIGYSTRAFYSDVIEGDFRQFHIEDTRQFGIQLMRGLSDTRSIHINSYSSVETAPQNDRDCSNYMDIEKVSKVKIDGKVCRKVDLVLNAIDPNTQKKYKQQASNIFCEGENNIKADFTGKDFDVIYEMNEIID